MSALAVPALSSPNSHCDVPSLTHTCSHHAITHLAAPRHLQATLESAAQGYEQGKAEAGPTLEQAKGSAAAAATAAANTVGEWAGEVLGRAGSGGWLLGSSCSPLLPQLAQRVHALILSSPAFTSSCGCR